MLEQNLALAIQKPNGDPKPNLGDESMALLRAGGLLFTFKPRVDDAPTNIPGLEIIKLKNADLAKAVAEGEADLGIVGLDMYQEFQGVSKASILKPLSYSRCTVKLGVKSDLKFRDPQDLANLRIATSYVNVASAFFRDWGTEVEIRPYQGGEEGIVKRGFAEACVVISDSGTSFTVNGLKPAWDVLESQAMLIANPRLLEKKGSEQIVWRALRTIMTGLWKTQYTLLKFNYPESLESAIMGKTPARESPTKTPLDKKGWKAAETLMPIANREEIETNLLNLGAQDLVYAEVERLVPNLDDPEVNRMMRVIYEQSWKLPSPHLSV